MPTKMIPRVVLSLHGVLGGPQGQQRIKFDLEESEVAQVFIPGLGRVPAIVALRLVLEKVDPHSQYWELVVAPYEPKLLTRLLGQPDGRLNGVSYQVTATLKEAIKVVSVTEPPEGTVLQATFAFTKNGHPRWDWHISSIESAERRHDAAHRHNALMLAGSFGYGWLRSLTGWGLVPVPPKPTNDPWVKEYRHEIGTGIEEHLFTVLQSLWKAAFGEGDAAAELKAGGYAMDTIGRTQLGNEGLREVFARARDHRMTVITKLG